MRGTHADRQSKIYMEGIIPAYAGNTDASSRSMATSRDHPRVCGEHQSGWCCMFCHMGSSPRMRGTRIPGVLRSRRSGIIPAYAGNTHTNNRRTCDAWDHPRVCGEHLYPLSIHALTMGSSPRMRGTPIKDGRQIDGAGIIPAYAGNTCWCRRLGCRIRDHPRVCGEHSDGGRGAHNSTGSSPRMRGTLISAVNPRLDHVIIPAYAGNTGYHPARHRQTRDHPRVCGEHLRARPEGCAGWGSSPRMRGTQSVHTSRMSVHGIIPAYAGNTSFFQRSSSNYRDHPRVCGEHFPIVACCGMAWGSSPRMRGTPRPLPSPMFGTGIIPAYAGNTLQSSGITRHIPGIIPAYAGNTTDLGTYWPMAWDHPRVCGEHKTLKRT